MTLLGDAQVRRGVLFMAIGSVLFAPALIPQTPPLLNWVPWKVSITIRKV
ncbi:MAG: hypothetical protein RI531_09275 [Haloferacaceae archaeon]|nr:hypothetical protein [Haloferacaceae archaeon]